MTLWALLLRALGLSYHKPIPGEKESYQRRHKKREAPQRHKSR